MIRAGAQTFADDGTSVGFLTDPPIRPLRGTSGWWELCGELLWRRTDGVLDVVPEGFICNLASIPRPIWLLDHPAATWLIRGSVVHDWHCATEDAIGSSAAHRQWQQMVAWDAETRIQRAIKAPLYGRMVRTFGPRW